MNNNSANSTDDNAIITNAVEGELSEGRTPQAERGTAGRC